MPVGVQTDLYWPVEVGSGNIQKFSFTLLSNIILSALFKSIAVFTR